MGGDFAPKEIVLGAIQALRAFDDISVILCGKEKQIKEFIEEDHSLDIKIINADEDIAMDEKNPARAVKRAQNSSLVLANKLVKSKEADAVIAAGHTGAATAASLFEIGRIEGFDRPCICTIIPTIKDTMLLVDGGSNIEAKPEHLLQSAILANLLAKILFKKANPKIGLLNIGEEEGKGTSLYRESYALLKACPELNFIGNVEGKLIIDGICDVAICDGFTGNIHLKALEGGLKMFASALQNEIKSSNLLALIGGFFLKQAQSFDNLKKHFHPNSYGGALLGGIDGVSIISHGSSNAEAIKNACKHAKLLVANQVISKIKKNLT